ncbi:MAG: hypothetical protein Q9220_005501 [cf. Caloplaca sp. 1 TL-2023]
MAAAVFPTAPASVKASPLTKELVLVKWPIVTPRILQLYLADIDLTAVLYLAEVFCAPVGGVLTMPTNSTGTTNSSTTTTNSTTGMPSPSPFTGAGDTAYGGSSGVAVLLVTGSAMVMGLMML